ncbi:serine/threonine-protein kinase Nek1 isoform X2 [Oryzias latipes]|uniref:serine/threonine-protein kinase Nek1 isoform X2 n=1 Tax=Oryzias latipes TaxID=8090 RepID=UPI0005CBFB9B|nr:serine/threonine-protein kinase Nek1 isoform X2 [Oryzias latipes]
MDKYENVKQIGEGSFGKAILVNSKEDGRQYVIKEIGISGMSTKERRESRKEVSVLANMSHPNIVQYKESFEEGGCLYIVMDYCEGGDLFKKINSQKGVLFSEDQILDWFVQICLALKHVHGRKILHRDIKSQNIFLTKDGTVQLGDFGIARVLNSTVELARTCIGTPYYLSPEICENKPYNNKSDIWALGCVLYEMCTLKHAFEAGNMKNLVLKIIRGSYPPVSVHYSPELRSLLAQLFRRNPRERPSVSSILEKPFLSCRIEKFLPPQIIAQEFRHTFIHKQPKMVVAQVPTALKITKPACKYGVPLTVRKVTDGARKPSDRRAALKHKPAPLPAAHLRRGSQVEEERKKQEENMKKKRMELMEKDRRQREQMFMLKAEQMKRCEKEKITRINQAREQGWKHILTSSGGSSPERKCFVRAVKRAAGAASPAPASSKSPPEQSHPALDQTAKPQHKDASWLSAGPRSPLRGEPAAAGPVLPSTSSRRFNHSAIKRELQRLQCVSKHVHISRQRGQMAAERAFQVEEFLQRKREAMLNKVRAEGQLEYLTRLRQIRLQNFNERQQIKARLRGEKYDSDGSDSQEANEEAELRRKKIEALKAQANARAAVLKEQLEKKRQEAHEREKRAWEDHLASKGLKEGLAGGGAAVSSTSDSEAPAPPASNPSSPAISMTAALKNIGAITSPKETISDPAAAIQSQKTLILQRLNQNLKPQSPGGGSAPAPSEPGPAVQQNPPSSNGDRRKWEAAELPVLPLSEQTSKETCPAVQASSPEDRPAPGGDRRRWDAGLPLVVPAAQQTLEETCFTLIDHTVGDVIQMGGLLEDVPREEWGASPVGQVLTVLQEAEPQPLSQQMASSTMNEDGPSGCDKPDPAEELTSSEDQSVAEETPNLHESQGPVDLECVVLEEGPKPASSSPVDVQQAWQHRPLDAVSRPTDMMETEKTPEPSASLQQEEPLFVKFCSPVHRRTAALAVLSPQSSMDESSSSLASRSRSVSPLRSKQQNALLIGLSTGMFDANNPKMLRTCSLPDLGRLFSPQREGAATSTADAVPENNLELEDLEDAAKEEEQSEAEDAYEDEDLQDIRASMERLLQEEAEEAVMAAGDLNGNPAGDAEQELFSRQPPEMHPNNQMAVDDEEEDDDDDEEGDDDDEEEADEEDEECSNGSPGDEEAGELLSNGMGEERCRNNKQLNEEWHSDGSEEDQGGASEHHDSIFSRLEELRFDLEQQMGFEKFIEAYNKIKAIHEDEDENIELGSSLVLSILGTKHQHLYPNILHLVMADGAYQEDNDEECFGE